jgi:phospholipid-binding lipoprotein MlaA
LAGGLGHPAARRRLHVDAESDLGAPRSARALQSGRLRFNTDFDKAFFSRSRRGYQAITPDPVERGVTNFFGNLADVTSFVNNVLQFKMSRAGSDVGRLFINSTVGVLGFVDVATNVGLPSYKEDFGQTLGYWGLDSGAFIMLPLPGTEQRARRLRRCRRRLHGSLVQPRSPLRHRQRPRLLGSVALGRSIKRANYLATSEILEDAAIDPYILLRDAYLQRRHYRVHDGNPPVIEGEEDFWDEVDFD